MKYMGSKSALLANGLGRLIVEEARRANRVVDLFCGSAAVSWYAAENTGLPVLAIDLQQYAVVLARSVIGRTCCIDSKSVEDEWFGSMHGLRENSETWLSAQEVETGCTTTAQIVRLARELCSGVVGAGPIWGSYGGHYFSPSQAATLDALLQALPEKEPMQTVCLAATIASGSHCAASPGHTAQPFQATPRASRFLAEAWARDPLAAARRALERICAQRASFLGEATVGDAVDVSSSLCPSDLVVVDPPYSGVQYSRFYHVLETIARRSWQHVAGTGRYPPLECRPQSSFSRPSESKDALETLLKNLAESESTVIFTFPVGESSNGLSGEIVTEMARRLFEVEQRTIVGQFSTLGGNNTNRVARSKSEELVLLMRSKSRLGKS